MIIATLVATVQPAMARVVDFAFEVEGSATDQQSGDVKSGYQRGHTEHGGPPFAGEGDSLGKLARARAPGGKLLDGRLSRERRALGPVSSPT